MNKRKLLKRIEKLEQKVQMLEDNQKHLQKTSNSPDMVLDYLMDKADVAKILKEVRKNYSRSPISMPCLASSPLSCSWYICKAEQTATMEDERNKSAQ